MSDSPQIFGHSWKEIQAIQRKAWCAKMVDLMEGKDYGSDPFGDGMFKMVPSGDIVNLEERNRRLSK